MIQLHQYALFVAQPDGHVEPFNIHDFVRHVAENTEFEQMTYQPWILDHVIESIFRHFREELRCDKITLSELIELTQDLLRGFLGQRPSSRSNSKQIDLFDVASRCGTGFELEFFAEMKRFLVAEKEKTVSPSTPETQQHILELTGLKRCAKYLAGRQRWSKNCSKTRDEIISYIRKEAVSSGIPNLAIAVLS